MSVHKDLRWLRTPGLKGPAKRFAEFCKTDIRQQTKNDPDFDIEIYNGAAKFILKKLQPSTPHSTAKDGQ